MKKVPSILDKQEGNPMLTQALRYAARGWHVFPVHSITERGFCTCSNPTCNRQGKHPRTQSGLNDATTDPAIIRHWWTQWPNANIGIRTGRISGIFVIDVDSRVYHDGKDGEESLYRLESKYGKLPDTVEALTGGIGGRHLYFKYPQHLEGGIKSRTNTLGPGVDVRGDGGYVIAPPSEGLRGHYTWEGSSDPEEGQALAEAPDWLIDLVTSEIKNHDGGDYGGLGNGFLHPKTAEELRDALRYLDPDEDYDQWIQVGMALKSTDAGETAYQIWDEWSRRGPKYKPGETAYKWRTFSVDGGLNKETIFYWASQRGWVNPLGISGKKPEVAVDPSPVWTPPDEDRNEQKLFKLPGTLDKLFQWAMSRAHRPQPHLTVNAILAGMSAIMSRKYRTVHGNWPALYFLNIAKSGAGKEHAKQIVELMLEAAGLEDRISGSGYTSPGAVFSQLERRPAHLSIIDEMGKFMGSVQAHGNQNRLDAMTCLMEVWGRCDGILRPTNYSLMGVSQAQADAMNSRKVIKPAITLLGMATPGTFYQSLSGTWIEDGFLGRFIIVESSIGRQPGRFAELAPMPEELAAWLQAVANPSDGNLAQADLADMEPTFRTVAFDQEAKRLFAEFEIETIALMDELEKDGIEALIGRDVEKAMRLSIIVAARPGLSIIDASAARWAIDYVRYHSRKLINAVRNNLHESEFAAVKQHVLELIRRKGERGMTVRELSKCSRKFRALKPREQNEVLEGLRAEGLIEFQEIQTSGRGKKRQAWVAITPKEDDDK